MEHITSGNHAQVLRGVGITHLAVVLLEGHVEHMMATVLHRPVPADDLREACGICRQAAEVIVCL